MTGKKRVTTSKSSTSRVRKPAAERKRPAPTDRLLRSVVAAGDLLPWEWDIAKDRFRWGASPKRLLGPVAKGMAAHPDLRAIVHPDDRARFLAAGREAMETLGSYQLQFRILLAGGAIHDVIARGHSYAETGAKPTHVVGVIIEVGQRVRERYDADAVALQHRALLDSLPDVAWLKDAKGRLIAVNLAFSKRYDIAAEAAAGKTDFDIYPPDKAAGLLQEDNQVMSSRAPIRYESSHEFDGRSCWVEVVKAPIFDAGGRVIGTVGTSRDISARKVAERNMEDSERRFRLLAEMSSDWYWEQDRDFRFTGVFNRSDHVLDFRGMIGRCRWDTPIEDVTAEQWRAHRATLDAHLPFHGFDYTSVQPNGTRHRFSISGKPVYDDNGEFSGYLGVGSDISERVAADAELRLAKERLELALEGSRLALWDTNFETGEVYLSEAWAQILGLPPGETRTTTNELAALAHPDDLPEVQQLSLATVRGTRDDYAIEHRVRAADGSWRWIMSRGRVSARDVKGRALRMCGTNLDITGRKEMETSMRLALNRSEVLLQTTPTAIALVCDRVIVRCNPAMDRLFGAEPGALVGCSTRVLFPGDEEWRNAGERYIGPVTHGEIYTDEFEFIRANGERFGAVTAGRQIEPGSPEMLFTYTDVTVQRNLARALAAARELADAASKAKSGFLATMSHEIRTPMNGVLGMLELLDLSDLDGDQRETLKIARDSAIALLRLIDDILDFSKIEAGQLEILPEPVSLGALAKRAATVYIDLASRKGLLLECHIDARIARAHLADGLRVTQILNNLLSNAIKFTSRGKVELAAESAERSTQEEVVRLRVTDTGIGIPAEQQGRLFQPFVQADSDTTRNFGGSGLGLSICRRLAEMMGGSISLQSEPGKGTTMTVLLRLPIADATLIDSHDSARREQSVALSQSGKAANPFDARILVADDHPVNLTLIQRQLALLGYQTDLACDGVAALEKWKTGRFALLLTDCHMPRMDGYQLAREIRRLEAASGAANAMPIVACTANAFASDVAMCFESGMNDYLIKPITLPTLKSKLEHWIVADRNATASETVRGIPIVPTPIDSALQASRADQDEGPLDSHALAEFTGGDDTLRREILRQYLAADLVDAGELRRTLAGEDVAAIAKAAHRIKGASRTIGAQSYAAVTDRIERAARAENQAAILECIGEFDREHARLVTYLRVELGDPGTAPGTMQPEKMHDPQRT